MSVMLRTSPEERELEMLTKRYAGFIQQRRLEALGRKLVKAGPLRVRYNACGFSGDRWTIYLRDGYRIRLKLYWPEHAIVSTVLSLRWHARQGWRVVVSRIDGRQLVLCAYHAELGPRPIR